jgi:hypothetical protein
MPAGRPDLPGSKTTYSRPINLGVGRPWSGPRHRLPAAVPFAMHHHSLYEERLRLTAGTSIRPEASKERSSEANKNGPPGP